MDQKNFQKTIIVKKINYDIPSFNQNITGGKGGKHGKVGKHGKAGKHIKCVIL